MTPPDLAALLERVRTGRPTIVLGTLPPLPPSLEVVRIACGVPKALGPLDRARHRIETLLDGRPHTAGSLAARAVFEEERQRTIAERFTAACNRLAARAPGTAVLVLDAIDAADATTHNALARILAEPGRLLLPIILVIRSTPHGSFLQVVEAIAREAKGTELTPTRLGPPALGAQPLAAAEDEASDAQTIRALDPATLRVLRAASVVGAVFEIAPVAVLLDVPEPAVLDALQSARDAAVPLEDDGNGHFCIPPSLRHALVSSLLPSLRRSWQRRLGDLFSKQHDGDPIVAAEHLDEAGERAEAVLRRLDAVAALLQVGDTDRAITELVTAENTLGTLSRGPAATLARTRAKLERARLAWLGGPDPAFTLTAAFAAALAVHAELGAVAPARVRVDAASTIAGIAYDLGDGASLEKAQAVVGDVVSSLVDDASLVDAALLLNDQAAIALRLGQHLRAMDLLSRSRHLLDGYVKENPDDTKARLDLAATHHLLARGPLHGTSEPPSPEAIAAALRHAEMANAVFRELDMLRDVGRVMETRARLFAKDGRIADAEAAFTAAMRLAEQLGDVTGLARVTAGLAELLSDAGTPRDALEMLASSIAYNRAKRSPIGLSFDERVLSRVETTLAARRERDPALREELARVRDALVAAIEAT